MEEIGKLRKKGACQEALSWLETQPNWQIAWDTCDRGDWMLWLIGKMSASLESRQKLVLTACQCARLTLPYTSDDRPLKTIETAEAWTRGEATLEMVREAVRAAKAAAYAAYAAADAASAGYVAASAADAAYAAAFAAYAAADVAFAAHAVAFAAYAADAADLAGDITLRQCADIIRKHYPTFKL